MSNETIRVGIVGAGANTRSRHIPGLQAIEGVKIVTVANRSRASGEKVAAEFGIGRVEEDWRRLVESDDVDAVVIGTWPYMHCPVTLAALAADKHVLCEARMAMNAAEARSMRDAARARPHLTAQIVPSPMTLGVDATIVRLLREGYLGEVLAIEVRAGGAFVNRDVPLHWREDARLSGLNVMSMGIWYEAVMRWVGEAKRVAAMGSTFVKMRPDETGTLRAVKIPDHLDVVAKMVCGAQAHFQFSSVTGGDDRQGAYLFGSEGTVHFAGGKLRGIRRGSDAWEEITPAAGEAAGWRVEEEFIGAIRGAEPVRLTTFDDGVRYMEFTSAVACSMARRKAVAVAR